MAYAVGLMWDAFTPQVQGQMTKDLIALKDQPQANDLNVFYAPRRPEIDAVIKSIGATPIDFDSLPTLWITYQTGPNELEPPENAKEVVHRDMQVKFGRTDYLDPNAKNGHYLAPQGRNIHPTIDLNRPMPGWYPGGPTPSIVLLWGSTKPTKASF